MKSAHVAIQEVAATAIGIGMGTQDIITTRCGAYTQGIGEVARGGAVVTAIAPADGEHTIVIIQLGLGRSCGSGVRCTDKAIGRNIFDICPHIHAAIVVDVLHADFCAIDISITIGKRHQGLGLCKGLARPPLEPYDIPIGIAVKVASERQQVIISVAIHVLAIREEQVVAAIVLLVELGKLARTVVVEEHGVGIARAVERSREGDEDIHIAIAVEVVAIHLAVYLYVLVQGLHLKVAIATVYSHPQLLAGEDKVLYVVAIEVGHHHRTTEFGIDPASVATIIIEHTVLLVDEVDISVGIEVERTSGCRHGGIHTLGTHLRSTGLTAWGSRCQPHARESYG